MTVVNSTLRPGLLVSLKTTLAGGISYQKQIIESPNRDEDGVEHARWETVRTITDREEHDLGRKTQLDARSKITKICTNTAFGLLCPEADKELLDRAVVEARALIDSFNSRAQVSQLSLYVIAGRIAPDDVEAVKAINAEVRGLLKSMEEGIANCDVAAIRSAANEAKRLGGMLSAEAAGRVTVAIEAARSAARRIVKAGEQAAQEVDRSAIARLTECRTSFLDLDESREVASPEAEARALDLLIEGVEPVRVPTVDQLQIDLEDFLETEES